MEPRATHARKEYEQAALDEATVARDPILQFAAWYDAAVAAGVPEPEAMTLSTATPDGRPSARIVLLRGFDARGFCFFTNYDSRKGRELTENPHASLTFHWADLERQVRIEGRVEQTTAAESDEYFRTRPSTSRIGAWSSPQSEVIPDRAALEAPLHREVRRGGVGPRQLLPRQRQAEAGGLSDAPDGAVGLRLLGEAQAKAGGPVEPVGVGQDRPRGGGRGAGVELPAQGEVAHRAGA